MRTTVDIPDPVYRQLKGKAAKEGRSIKQLILQAVEKDMYSPPEKVKLRRAPVIHTKHPGTLVLDNDKIFEIIPFP